MRLSGIASKFEKLMCIEDSHVLSTLPATAENPSVEVESENVEFIEEPVSSEFEEELVEKNSADDCKEVLREIDNTLEAKQAYVGGHIQCIRLTPEIDMVLNDDGKTIGLPINRIWFYEDEPVDFLVGNLLFCRHDNEGNFTSILVSDVPIIKEHIKFCIAVGDMIFPVDEDMLPDYCEED